MTNKMEGEPTYEDISRVYYRLFRTIGLLPSSSTLLTALLTVYFQLANAFYYTMQMSDGLRMLRHDDAVEIEYVFEAVLIHGLCSRFLILYYRRKEFARLLLSCEELWHMLKPGEGQVVKHFEKKVKYLMHYFTWTTLAAIFFYIITAQIVRLPPAEINGTDRRILPFRFYVDVQKQPWYKIASVFEAVVECSAAVILAAVETAGPFLIMMACGYLRSIQNRLLVIAETANSSDKVIVGKESCSNRLSTIEIVTCVKFHQKIMRFCQDVENLTSSLFLMQVMCTAYNISLIGLRLLKHDPNAVKYVPILLLNLLQFFTSQWIPEHLLNESKTIANAAYCASLVHLEYDPTANQALLFIMLRADRPVQMTAGGYIKLSLETFERMLMSAMSFFTVLRSMNDGIDDGKSVD